VTALLAIVVATATSLAKPDELCAKVKAFHSANFDNTVLPRGRRWVELHWVGSWLDLKNGWGFACRHSPDQASTALCRWLMHHTSYEFSDQAPKRILTCYGYRFPQNSEWGDWKSQVTILDHDRWLKLDINFATFIGEEGAIRLSSFAPNEDDALVELPPLAPLKPK
jgi:hypothetical protein